IGRRLSECGQRRAESEQQGCGPRRRRTRDRRPNLLIETHYCFLHKVLAPVSAGPDSKKCRALSLDGPTRRTVRIIVLDFPLRPRLMPILKRACIPGLPVLTAPALAAQHRTAGTDGAKFPLTVDSIMRGHSGGGPRLRR